MSAGNLPFSLALALRYLRSTRKDAFVSFLSLVAAAGIGLGVAALVLALAALTGMQEALTSEILARTPALEVQLPARLGPAAVALLAESLRSDSEVTAVQQALSGKGWIVVSGRAMPVEVTGFEGEVPAQFPGASGEPPGLYLGDREAARLGIAPATIVTIASPRPTLTPFGPQPRAVNLRLAGLFHSGKSEQRARAALPIERAVQLFGADRPRRLLVTLTSLDAAAGVATRLSSRVPEGSRISTWQELNRPLFFALRLEKSVMFVAVSLIVVVAALALIADLSLIAANKRREIGLLIAMGGSAGTLRAAFCWLGAMLGGIGTLAGAAVGSAAAVILDRARLIRMPGDVYFLDYLPFAVPVRDLAVIVAVTLLWALACSWYGASRVAQLDPMAALRS
ncbi:MAG: ABC transporter permease [Thermoanaerobaculia bacterium]|nr:ABC transporter permease [Thermoanaerobaculia bacterium]